MNLGDKILKIRKDNKMSQEQLAEVLNVTRQTVSNWENGNNYPDIETLIMISDKFKVSLDILLKGDKEMIKDINKKITNNKILKRVIIFLSLVIVILSAGYIVYREYFYRTKIIYRANKADGYITNKCNLDGKRLRLMASVHPVCSENGKVKIIKNPLFIEDFDDDAIAYTEEPCTCDFIDKPSGFNIIDNNTKEQQKELMDKMNINLDDYDSAYDLLEGMTDYIISIGGTCDNR